MKLNVLKPGFSKNRRSASLAPQHADTEFQLPSLSNDYEAFIGGCFAKMGLRDEICVSVRPVGVNPAGLEIYAGFVKVVQWAPSVVELLANMPLIERRIERRLQQSAMLQYSRFAGLWFRSPAGVDQEMTAGMH